MKHEHLDLKRALNPEQYQAAVTLNGPLLIIAGAGSGKTRMITYRIAHMLESGIPQSSILALTFTNKAAQEMSQRIRELTREKLPNLTTSTFHAFGVQILRRHAETLGYFPNFTIFDQADMHAMIKEAAGDCRISYAELDFYFLVQLFGRIKNGEEHWNQENRAWEPLFNEYCEHMKAYNAVDFNDLITLPLRLFEEHPEILETWQNRYRYIMVDEFQDTSSAQYRLLRILGEKHRNVCAVGDDDQSIYSWRGADYTNIINFERDFPETREIKLEQNYRSTGTILSAANTVIANNTKRKKKELWTGEAEGSAISIHYPENETEEAEFISAKIRELHVEHRMPFNQIGVLVRTNGLLQKLEEEFLAQNIPYAVSGGRSFFQRKEIKDVIGYLRVLANPDNDVDFLRIINTPKRGLGKHTILTIRETAERLGCSLYSASAALTAAADSPLQTRYRDALAEFMELLERYRNACVKKHPQQRTLAQPIRRMIEQLEFRIYLLHEHPKNDRAGLWKYEQIERFITMIETWEQDPDNHDPSIFNYLNRISLVSKNEPETDIGKINLMTIHAAKGLEFDAVFLAGVEAHILPHARSIDEDPNNIEEERRLFYVALTRARKVLHITSCRQRKIMRDTAESLPSPFLKEIPEHLLKAAQEERTVAPEESGRYFAKLRERLQKSG